MQLLAGKREIEPIDGANGPIVKNQPACHDTLPWLIFLTHDLPAHSPSRAIPSISQIPNLLDSRWATA